MTIRVIDKAKSEARKEEYSNYFKFVVDWIEDNICGIDTYIKVIS